MARIRKNQDSLRNNAIIWRVALYVRLSREDGNDESLSVVNQKKILTEFVGGFDETFEIVDYYIEMITLSLIQSHYKGSKSKTQKDRVFQEFFSIYRFL